MIDHVGLAVSDFAASRRFYLAALGAIGLEIVSEGETWAGFGRDGKGAFWFSQSAAPSGRLHIAFGVEQRWLVEAFHEAGLAAGGRDNGAPGLRPHYHADYYGAFLLDPDGHNIEAVCHRPA